MAYFDTELSDLMPRDMAALSIFLEVNDGSEDARCAGCGVNETTADDVADDDDAYVDFVVHGDGWTTPRLGGTA